MEEQLKAALDAILLDEYLNVQDKEAFRAKVLEELLKALA